jgi:DNA-binding NtrC family response regulator
MHRLVTMSIPGRITPDELRRALEIHTGDSREEPSDDLDAVERQQILKVLDQAGGNKTRAAEILGIQRRTLYKKLARIQKD